MWAEEAPVWFMAAEVHIPVPARPVPIVVEVIPVGIKVAPAHPDTGQVAL